MRVARYSRTRQRVCYQCSEAKVRCDRTTGSCKRCLKRRLRCRLPEDPGDSHQEILTPSQTYLGDSAASDRSPIIYTDATAAAQSHSNSSHGLDHIYNSTSSPIISANDSLLTVPKTSTTSDGTSDVLDFSNLDLLCSINADDVCNRWLNTYVPDPAQKNKNYPPAISAFIHQMLKSYATVVVQGRGIPPFIHDAQLKDGIHAPLLICLTVVRIFKDSLLGSSKALQDILLRAMRDLYDEQLETSTNMLSVFQAYLIYTMVLFFHINGDHTFLHQAMMNLQNIASACCKEGIVCAAELHRQRPTWEAWIVAEAKRRTLYVMYLLDSALSTRHGLPTMLGTELSGLPAASPKKLWQARSRNEWESAYNLHFVDWADGDLKIDELWPVPGDFDEPKLERRRQRTDHWLVGLDEFGVMLYTVTSCTHGH